MSNNKNISKSTETIISFIIIMLLCGVGFAVFYAQRGFDPVAIGFGDTQNANIDQNNTEIGFDISQIAVDGFVLVSDEEIYTHDTLYEKINGKAPFYIEAGFEKLVTVRIMDKENEADWAEMYIYDMNSSMNAYAVYSGQKRENVELLGFVENGYKTSNSIFFTVGRYYVEFIGASDSSVLIEKMASTGENFAKSVSTGEKKFDVADYFSPDGLDKAGITVYKKDAFGFSGFVDLFSGDYLIDGEYLTGFVVKNENVEHAEELFEKYKKHLLSSGFQIKNEQGRIWVMEYDGIFEIIFQVNGFVAGVHEAFALQPAETLARQLHEHLANLQ